MFVADLKNSGLDYAIIRPTGYYSDMSEFLNMASSGRVYLLGDGRSKINPVHGADLARVCVDAVENKDKEIPVGGPETFTYNQIARLAFSVLGRSPYHPYPPVAGQGADPHDPSLQRQVLHHRVLFYCRNEE